MGLVAADARRGDRGRGLPAPGQVPRRQDPGPPAALGAQHLEEALPGARGRGRLHLEAGDVLLREAREDEALDERQRIGLAEAALQQPPEGGRGSPRRGSGLLLFVYGRAQGLEKKEASRDLGCGRDFEKRMSRDVNHSRGPWRGRVAAAHRQARAGLRRGGARQRRGGVRPQGSAARRLRPITIAIAITITIAITIAITITITITITNTITITITNSSSNSSTNSNSNSNSSSNSSSNSNSNSNSNSDSMRRPLLLRPRGQDGGEGGRRRASLIIIIIIIIVIIIMFIIIISSSSSSFMSPARRSLSAHLPWGGN